MFKLAVAALESLRRPADQQILTPEQLYEFAKEKFRSVNVQFVSSEEIESLHTEVLEERFMKAKTIKGTLGFHSYSPIPGCYDKITVKQYDLSSVNKKVSVSKR